MYQNRFYREWSQEDLKHVTLSHKETDLYIRYSNWLPENLLTIIEELRQGLLTFIIENPGFQSSMVPYPVSLDAPSFILAMHKAATLAQVGPMATVAGLFAQKVGEELQKKNEEVLVENGGDIFLKLKKDRTIGFYAGEHSPFSGKLGLRIPAAKTPLGVCTSSGTVGPSFSYGTADAVTILSPCTLLSDAMATSVANKITSKDDIAKAIDYAKQVPGVHGVVIAKGPHIGFWGDLELVKTKC